MGASEVVLVGPNFLVVFVVCQKLVQKPVPLPLAQVREMVGEQRRTLLSVICIRRVGYACDSARIPMSSSQTGRFCF